MPTNCGAIGTEALLICMALRSDLLLGRYLNGLLLMCASAVKEDSGTFCERFSFGEVVLLNNRRLSSNFSGFYYAWSYSFRPLWEIMSFTYTRLLCLLLFILILNLLRRSWWRESCRLICMEVGAYLCVELRFWAIWTGSRSALGSCIYDGCLLILLPLIADIVDFIFNLDFWLRQVFRPSFAAKAPGVLWNTILRPLFVVYYVCIVVWIALSNF